MILVNLLSKWVCTGTGKKIQFDDMDELVEILNELSVVNRVFETMIVHCSPLTLYIRPDDGLEVNRLRKVFENMIYAVVGGENWL